MLAPDRLDLSSLVAEEMLRFATFMVWAWAYSKLRSFFEWTSLKQQMDEQYSLLSWLRKTMLALKAEKLQTLSHTVQHAMPDTWRSRQNRAFLSRGFSICAVAETSKEREPFYQK